eukprot:COSAG04_NODE_3807_length_2511_cov_2.242537_4_plen_114_part_00
MVRRVFPRGPQPPRQGEGTVAWLIRESHLLWGRQRWPAGRCRTALRAAQLRLALAFLQSERLTERCPLVLIADVSEVVAACIRVPGPQTPFDVKTRPAPCAHPNPPGPASLRG